MTPGTTSDAVSAGPAAPAGLTVAIIPARGGSQGVPGKNLRRVGGTPLVERAVRAAAAAGVDLVAVSTDDPGIAGVAAAAGARVIDRPAALAGDTASSESALLHALDELEASGTRVGTVVFLQATSPFIPADALARAIGDVRDDRFDSVFSAHATYGFLWRRDAGAEAVAINHDAAHRPRRQDREPHYLETGAFYVFSAEGFRRARHRFFGRVGIAEVPERTAIEIDDEHQLALAEALAGTLDAPASAASAASGGASVPAPIPATALVTDFDGVHTDDTATVDSEGRESVRVSREDGLGVSRLRRAGIPMLILSTEQNPVVARRADKLRVPVRHGVDDKAAALAAWADEQGIPLADIAYVGNDVNDLPALALAGWPVAVANAHPAVKDAARVVLTRRGGEGAVREVIERILLAAATPAP
ncbi:acylneuraminate cytidylyltransferase [Microbacterium sp. EF45047]|uniref:acylneuraminate cytidylyltransferase n=1 Tax=Microbacterium sp. EF45047 TaxID=2809708 RepID=UPI00234A22F9|nr:acylneuraminate cytidylyltransferase [Microbacterium sp. EF45047]WCM55663.1 acylneuraminate cytidylyltransferase [Microbacterium sp. EF45047]